MKSNKQFGLTCVKKTVALKKFANKKYSLPENRMPQSAMPSEQMWTIRIKYQNGGFDSLLHHY